MPSFTHHYLYMLELIRNVWTSRWLLLKVCCMGVVIGIVIISGIPKEYTANTLIAPESTRRSSSSGMSALADMAGIDMDSSTEQDAIYPSLYPAIVNSTPFLIRLFEVKVRGQKDSTTITLARYLQERQKKPWWSIVTSAPSKLVSLVTSMFRTTPEAEKDKTEVKIKTVPFRLTRTEAGIAGAIASRINIGVDKKKRTITIFVTMQDPLVAATVADTVRVHLKEYVTEYRTSKARRILKYTEELCKEAQEEYYTAQEKYTRYADTNRGLSSMTSRAELVKLQNEMNLAFSIYNQMEQQVQVAKAKVEKETPVYAVIQPVSLPRVPSKPRKIMILAGCILLSGAGSVVWILFRIGFERS